MANHKSAEKRNRQSQVRRMRNRAARSRMKSMVKDVLQAIEEKSLEKAQGAMKAAIKVIDKTAGKGIVHKNTASRKISRLAKRLNALSSNA